MVSILTAGILLNNSVSAQSQSFTREWTCRDDDREWLCLTETCIENSCDGPSPDICKTVYACGFKDIYPPDEDEEEEQFPKVPKQTSCTYAVPTLPSHVPQNQMWCGDPTKDPTGSKTCWASTITMMMSYRDGVSYKISSVLKALGEPYLTRYRENMDLPISANPDIIKKIGMAPLPLIYDPQSLKAALETYGVIYATFPPSAGADSYHVVLLVGMRDREGEEACKDPDIQMIDPLHESFEHGANNAISFSNFWRTFFSAPYNNLYVLVKSSQQLLQSEDITGDTNQPLSPGEFQENSDEDNGSGLGDGTNTVQSEEEELREEIEDDVDECDLFPDDPFCIALGENG